MVAKDNINVIKINEIILLRLDGKKILIINVNAQAHDVIISLENKD